MFTCQRCAHPSTPCPSTPPPAHYLTKIYAVFVMWCGGLTDCCSVEFVEARHTHSSWTIVLALLSLICTTRRCRRQCMVRLNLQPFSHSARILGMLSSLIGLNDSSLDPGCSPISAISRRRSGRWWSTGWVLHRTNTPTARSKRHVHRRVD